MGLRDIETRDDLDRLLRLFYTRAMVDPLIGYLFTEIANLDLEHHLPRIGNFWEQILLQRPVYAGNPMAVHVPLHQAATLTSAHFQRWFVLWSNAVDELFRGQVAERAKQRAAIIAETMQYRLGVASDEADFSDAYRAALQMPLATPARGYRSARDACYAPCRTAARATPGPAASGESSSLASRSDGPS